MRIPLNQVYYYTKDEQNIGLRISPQNNSFCVPAQHQELIVRMYSKAGTVCLNNIKKAGQKLNRIGLVNRLIKWFLKILIINLNNFY